MYIMSVVRGLLWYVCVHVQKIKDGKFPTTAYPWKFYANRGRMAMNTFNLFQMSQDPFLRKSLVSTNCLLYPETRLS